ncbi:MAG: hypothetical protein HYX63_20640 [Gammaproteobacteria bacterium]|nr:hypothetical protein [Gammaproteobacteria bacterium]
MTHAVSDKLANSGPTGSLMSSFDRVFPQIGADGTPYDYYATVRNEAIENGRYVGWCKSRDGFWLVLGYQEKTRA